MSLLSHTPANRIAPALPGGFPAEHAADQHPRRRLLETCANPGCRSGWLHLWRSRAVPVFEQGWTCGPECTRAVVARAVARELGGLRETEPVRRHRVPLGLLMLEQGWISNHQLRQALAAQRASGTGRLGSWLVRQGAVTEAQVTRALALQWSCPVLSAELQDPAAMAAAMPRLFVDAFGALPVRVAGGRVLYLGFEESPDPALAFAVERMMGLRVENGMVAETEFRTAHRQMLAASFPSAELVEAVSESVASHALAKAIERTKPVAARLVRVHECLWLRMWKQAPLSPLPSAGAVCDLVCSIGRIG